MKTRINLPKTLLSLILISFKPKFLKKIKTNITKKIIKVIQQLKSILLMLQKKTKIKLKT